MVDRGAKNIILLLRSAGRSKKAAVLADELAQMGCRVIAVSCDVASESNLEEVLRPWKKGGLLPIRGVIQGAMVLQVNLLRQRFSTC